MARGLLARRCRQASVMSAHMRFCSCLIFPLHETLEGHDSLAARRRLEASLWWPRAHLEA